MSSNIITVFLLNGPTCHTDLQNLASRADTDFSKKVKGTDENVFHLCFRENGEARFKTIRKGIKLLKSKGEINGSIEKALNSPSKTGLTPLHLAAQFSGEWKMTKKGESRSEVMYRMVNELLKLGADPTKCDSDRHTPDETYYISHKVKECLVEAKHKHFVKNSTKPLQTALEYGDLSSVHDIIDNDKINLDMSNSEKYSLLLLTIESGINKSKKEDQILEVLRKLYDKFTTPSFEMLPSTPYSPSSSTSSSSRDMEERAIQEPIIPFSQIIIDIEKDKDKTLLTSAVAAGYSQIVNFLINTCHVDVLKTDRSGKTILHILAEIKKMDLEHRSIYDQLIESGAEIQLHATNNEGKYPLHLAKNAEMCALLCTHAPDLVHAKDKRENEPENYYRGYRDYQDMCDLLTFFDPKVKPERKIELLDKITAIFSRMCPDEIPEKIKDSLTRILSSGLNFTTDCLTSLMNYGSSKIKSYWQ